ncbi:MAG: hypothetical protein LBS06_05360 [Treponema sp.]|jgi:hypothetical protein|nr:hypothetical protein [Treponema sp.]
MPKLYRKKTETEKALHAIKLWGMHPVKLQYIFGGDASEWGRILKGQHQAHGEYLAICKEINTHGYDAITTWAASKKKYGKRTRNGGIVPRTKHVFDDLYAFNVNRIIMNRIEKHVTGFEDQYDEYIFYCEQGMDIYAHGEQYPRTYFEEQTIRKNFLDSLKV